MKVIIIFCFSILATLAHAEVSSTRMSPATADSSGCELSVAGINSKEQFLKFFTLMKTAAVNKDMNQLTKIVVFPLRVNGDKTTVLIKTVAELKKKLPLIFTEKILSAIAIQDVGKLFCRDQGVMIGSGEVWIEQRGKKIGVATINL